MYQHLRRADRQRRSGCYHSVPPRFPGVAQRKQARSRFLQIHWHATNLQDGLAVRTLACMLGRRICGSCPLSHSVRPLVHHACLCFLFLFKCVGLHVSW